ncbi:MAG: hypothetical protein ACTS6J_06635 [Burkholderiales bacterium]
MRSAFSAQQAHFCGIGAAGTAWRDSFAARIRDDGVDGLIKALEDKNRQRDSRSGALRT